MGVLNWSHRAAEIRACQTFRRGADDVEREGLGVLIGNAKCLSLEAEYMITRDNSVRFGVVGRVRARLEQICGVTLEPTWQEIDEALEVVFEAGARQPETADLAIDPLGEDPREPIVDGRLEIGRIVAEIVASAADPFPRSADAELDRWEAGGGDTEEEGADNPFAVLRGLSAGSNRMDD